MWHNNSCGTNVIMTSSITMLVISIYLLRTWQGPQKLFRGFFIFSFFFRFFFFIFLFSFFSFFFARTVYITIQSDRVYQCTGKRTFATPKTNPNQASSKKKLVQKSQKLKKQGVLTVKIIPSSHKSAKIAIFSCQKSKVTNKIET